MTICPHALVGEARALLGVRFIHQGRDAQHGLDCLGMLMVVADRAGAKLQGQSPLTLAVPNYRTRPDTDFLRAQLEQHLTPIPQNAAQPGDVLLLAIHGDPQHLALLSDYPQVGEFGMIHAYAVARKVVEHRYDEEWKAVTRAVFRLA